MRRPAAARAAIRPVVILLLAGLAILCVLATSARGATSPAFGAKAFDKPGCSRFGAAETTSKPSY